MIKKICFLFVVVCLLFPFNVHAASITGTYVAGVNNAVVGSSFSLSFGISYSGVEMGSSDTLGVGGIAFELLFDDSVFLVSGVSSSGFDTKIIKSDGKYYVMSTISENDPFKNKCIDEVLFCADYLTSITFYVKDTDKYSSSIQMGETSVVLFKVNSDYSESSATTITSSSPKTRTVNITKTGSETTNNPQSIVSNSKPKDIASQAENKVSKSNTSVTKRNITTTSKRNLDDSNAYLNSISIKGHQIAFDKEKFEYNIYVDKKENTLDVKAETQVQTSNIKVIGADDLKSNNYKVLIEVLAKDGTKNTYVINANTKNNKFIDNETDRKDIKMNGKIINIIIIVIGVLFVIGIIVLLILHMKNKKLDKMFDEIDKF